MSYHRLVLCAFLAVFPVSFLQVYLYSKPDRKDPIPQEVVPPPLPDFDGLLAGPGPFVVVEQEGRAIRFVGQRNWTAYGELRLSEDKKQWTLKLLWFWTSRDGQVKTAPGVYEVDGLKFVGKWRYFETNEWNRETIQLRSKPVDN